MKRYGDYWKKVSILDAKYRINLTEDFINGKLARYYKDAEGEILEEIEAFYEKYAEQAGVSLPEAKRLIKTSEFKDVDFDSLIKRALNDGDARLHDLLNRLSKKGRISRLEQLTIQLEAALSRLYDREQTSVYEYLADTYADDYYHSVYSIDKFLGVRTSFVALDEKLITSAVTRDWGRGRFSKTIWGHRKELSEDLRGVITKHLIKGSGADKMARDLAKRCGVAFSDAKRLVRTEALRVHNDAALDAYKNVAGIEKYRFLAVLDFKTSVVCQNLDGAVLDVRVAQTGVNFPPMHPNCRSTVTTEMDEAYAGERLAKDADGNYYSVPANMKYHEWYDSLPEKQRLKMEQERKKARNLYADKKQFKEYKDAFKNSGMELPNSFSGFQELKYGGDWDRYKAEFRSVNSDAKQFERFRGVLKDAGLPGNLAEFRDLKYNRLEEFNYLNRVYKNEVKAEIFRRQLAGGEINLQVRQQKQREHILGAPEWQKRVSQSLKNGELPESAFYRDVDIQRLINENAGKGTIEFQKNAVFPKEYFSAGSYVGVAYNIKSRKYLKSERVAVHYSSKGTHAYPVPIKED